MDNSVVLPEPDGPISTHAWPASKAIGDAAQHLLGHIPPAEGMPDFNALQDRRHGYPRKTATGSMRNIVLTEKE